MIRFFILLPLLLIGGLLIYAATRPNQFRIERSLTMQAPPERIFPFLNDWLQFKRWSPWDRLDPHMQSTLSASTAGVGATYAWSGNKEVGTGRMEITRSTPNEQVQMQLYFEKPFKAHNTVEITINNSPQGTTVNYAMFGPSPFMSKLMGVFFNMDKMVGDKFEEGLANLQGLVEQRVLPQ